MPRKKRANMTPMERMEYIMTDATWDDAEAVGIEILARCMALHVYARKDGKTFFKDIMHRIAVRGDEWAHEGNHPTILAFAAVGYKYEKGQENEKE